LNSVPLKACKLFSKGNFGRREAENLLVSTKTGD
jgi:hypothetical protein